MYFLIRRKTKMVELGQMARDHPSIQEEGIF
jgi:hypothetical protein